MVVGHEVDEGAAGGEVFGGVGGVGAHPELRVVSTGPRYCFQSTHGLLPLRMACRIGLRTHLQAWQRQTWQRPSRGPSSPTRRS